MIKSAPACPTFTHPSTRNSTSPRAYANADGALVLDTGTRHKIALPWSPPKKGGR